MIVVAAVPVAASATRRRGGSGRKIMYYVYVIQSLKDRNLYIGKTRDLKKRFLNHQKGNVPATRTRIPFMLIYYEAFANRTDAGRDELFFKSGYGREVLRTKLKYSLIVRHPR